MGLKDRCVLEFFLIRIYRMFFLIVGISEGYNKTFTLHLHWYQINFIYGSVTLFFAKSLYRKF